MKVNEEKAFMGSVFALVFSLWLFSQIGVYIHPVTMLLMVMTPFAMLALAQYINNRKP